MSDRPIIEVENLGKRYRLGAGGSQRNERYTALRDVITEKARALLRRRWGNRDDAPPSATDPQEFWALQDVSFAVQPGEVVGIIGRNGAGKSTLLKILSRITEPTEGRVTLRGRVASLLEVGTGFHPELTGRENIYLNGAILGMSRAEIKSKFDEIVAFSEVQTFLDTPVKRYSSGMYVRLAFAVAAHLDPEILIIDEVLAVGDALFQKKCLGKMGEVAQRGRTVLFVSHNMNAVRQLTSRCLYLVRGVVAESGPTRKILDSYGRANDMSYTKTRAQYATIVEARLVDEHGLQILEHHGEPILWVEVVVDIMGHPLSSIECYLTNLEGTRLGLYSPGHFKIWRFPTQGGRWRCRLPLAIPPLASGNYGLDICTTLHGYGPDHYVSDAIVFATSSLANFPAPWELRKEYGAGYFVLDAGNPRIAQLNGQEWIAFEEPSLSR